MKKGGVNGTSVDDVLSASDTGKSQFYHYFTSKDGLVRELVALHLEALQPAVSDEALGSLTDLDKLDQWLDRFVEGYRAGLFEDGCPIGTMAAELASQNETLRLELQVVFAQWEARLAASLRLLKGKGLLKPEAAPDQLAAFALAALQGALLLAKTAKSVEPLRHTVAHLKQHVRSHASAVRRPGASAGRGLPLGFCP